MNISTMQNAVVQEALKLSALFRQNATTKHGIPKDYGLTALQETKEEPAPAPTPATPTNETPSPGSQPAAVLGPLGKAAAAGLIAGGIIGGPFFGVALYDWFTGKPPAIEREQTEAERDGSLYQYLQDKGLHVPPGGE